jgi:hypothetical protein
MRRFSFRLGFAPLPSVSADPRLAAYAQAIEAEIEGVLRQAEADLIDRILACTSHLQAKLGNAGSIFRDSLLANLQELVLLGETSNVTNNPGIGKAIAVLKSALAKIPNANSLRNDPVLAANVAGDAAAAEAFARQLIAVENPVETQPPEPISVVAPVASVEQSDEDRLFEEAMKLAGLGS